jgi:CheY-like chemotaxis protein
MAGSTDVPAQSGKRRILIVEDDESITMLLKDTLGEIGLDVHSARAASDALEQIARQAPHMILVDLVQPDGDGWSFLERCRQQSGCPRLPIAVMSTTLAEADASAAARERGYGWLAKPFRLDHLHRVIDDLNVAVRCSR